MLLFPHKMLLLSLKIFYVSNSCQITQLRVTSYIYLRPKVTLHCKYICIFRVLISVILNVFDSYQSPINSLYES